MSFFLQIKNRGPSNITSLDLFIYLPTKYTDPITKSVEELIDIEKVSVYNEGQKFDVKWFQVNELNSSVALATAAAKNDSNIGRLSEIQTIYFDCSDPGYEHCFKGKLTKSNINVTTSLVITLTFPIHTKKFANITNVNNFVLFSSIVVQKPNGDNW